MQAKIKTQERNIRRDQEVGDQTVDPSPLIRGHASKASLGERQQWPGEAEYKIILKSRQLLEETG